MVTNLNISKQEFPPIHAPNRILLGPGPSMVDPRILEAMSIPLVGHLDPFFLELMNKIKEISVKIKRLFNIFWDRQNLP